MTNRKTTESRAVVMNSLKSLFWRVVVRAKRYSIDSLWAKMTNSMVWCANDVPKMFCVQREHTKNGNLVVQFENGTNVCNLCTFFFIIIIFFFQHIYILRAILAINVFLYAF